MEGESQRFLRLALMFFSLCIIRSRNWPPFWNILEYLHADIPMDEAQDQSNARNGNSFPYFFGFNAIKSQFFSVRGH